MKFIELYCEQENQSSLVNLDSADFIISRSIPENDEDVFSEYEGYKYIIRIDFSKGRATYLFKSTETYKEQIQKIKDAIQSIPKTNEKVIPFNWEDINYGYDRAKVFGGWIVRGNPEVPVTFVPDPNHEWEVE